LSKVADGKRTTGYADEDFIAGLWQQQSYTMKLFASYFREIKLDTTNTLWSDLALTGVLRNLKIKLNTTCSRDLLGNNANSYHPTYFTTIEEAFACWEKIIK
jgi:hypothetical protein